MEQIGTGARNAQHVAIRNECQVGTCGKLQSLVDHFQGSDTDRAPRPVNQFHFPGQKLVDAVAHDGMGLAAANLHQHPRASYALADLLRERAGNLLVTILVEVFHSTVSGGPCAEGANSPSRSPIASRIW